MMKSEERPCVHCGEDCGKYPVVWQNKDFCCEGCKTVYQILNENKLENYYQIYDNPGIKVELEDFGSKYSYLDNEEIIKQIVYFKDGDFSKVRLYIPDIHCSSCIWLLENLYQLNKAITYSTVNFVKKEVDISFKHTEISLRQVVELLASIHYVPMITLESVDDSKYKSQNKKLIYKIGVAGFVFFNTMIYSLPEYLPGKEFLEADFKSLFSFLNLLLALPIIFYSGSDYIISAYKNLKHKIINIDLPISIGILAIFFESTYQIISQTGTGYMDSLAGLVFFLLIGKWYQNKTYQSLSFERDYKSYFPLAVTKISNDGEESIQLKDLKKNDRIIIRNQEIIPADGILISDTANINYSFVTGESKPVVKHSGDEIYAGGKQIGSTIEIEIIKEVAQSKLTKLWNQNIENKTKKKNLNSIIDLVSHRFTLVIISIAIISAIVWWFIDPSKIVYTFASVLIVACPCALALALPFSFGSALRHYGRNGLYLKKSDVVESLNKVDTIVFDKTGTITYSDTMKVEFDGNELTDKHKYMVKSLSRQSFHPLSKSIFDYLNADYSKNVDEFREIPASGIIGIIDGAEVRMGSAKFVNAQKIYPKELSSTVYLAIDGEVLGIFTIKNRYRDGLYNVVDKLKKKYNLFVISGDNESEKESLSNIFGCDSCLAFNQSPADKLDFIKKLKSEGKKVLMIGDGLNDAGALNESDVGISIADDVFNFSPACDAILEADSFKKLPDFIGLTNKSLKIVYYSFALSFLYNVIGLSFAVSANLSPVIAAVIMPISSVSVVAFTTFSSQIALKKLYKS